MDVLLAEITIASQYNLHPGILAEYAARPPKRKRVILRPYGAGDDIAVADGHHGIVAARLRGETSIRARWMS